MAMLALVLSLMVAGLGLFGLVLPQGLLRFMRQFQRPDGLYWAAGFRLLLGGVLVQVAGTSHYPVLLHWLGWFIIVAGIVTPLFGQARLARLLDWWAARGTLLTRLFALLALAFGLALLYVLRP